MKNRATDLPIFFLNIFQPLQSSFNFQWLTILFPLHKVIQRMTLLIYSLPLIFYLNFVHFAYVLNKNISVGQLLDYFLPLQDCFQSMYDCFLPQDTYPSFILHIASRMAILMSLLIILVRLICFKIQRNWLDK